MTVTRQTTRSGRGKPDAAGESSADLTSLMFQPNQQSRRSGMDRRNPGSMDGTNLEHPCNLDTGNPCRYDVILLALFEES